MSAAIVWRHGGRDVRVVAVVNTATGVSRPVTREDLAGRTFPKGWRPDEGHEPRFVEDTERGES